MKRNAIKRDEKRRARARKVMSDDADSDRTSLDAARTDAEWIAWKFMTLINFIRNVFVLMRRLMRLRARPAAAPLHSHAAG